MLSYLCFVQIQNFYYGQTTNERFSKFAQSQQEWAGTGSKESFIDSQIILDRDENSINSIIRELLERDERTSQKKLLIENKIADEADGLEMQEGVLVEEDEEASHFERVLKRRQREIIAEKKRMQQGSQYKKAKYNCY